MSLCDIRDQCIKQKMCLDVFAADFLKKAEVLKAFSYAGGYSMAATMQTSVERERVLTGGFFFCFSAFKESEQVFRLTQRILFLGALKHSLQSPFKVLIWRLMVWGSALSYDLTSKDQTDFTQQSWSQKDV